MSNRDLKKMAEQALMTVRLQEEQRRRQAAEEDEADEDNATDGNNDDDGDGGDSDNDGTPDQPQKFLPCRYAPEAEIKELEVPDFSNYGKGKDNGLSL